MESLAKPFAVFENIHSRTKKSKLLFKNKILFAIQPLYNDTLKMLLSLQEAGLEIGCVIGLKYSSNAEVAQKLINAGVNCKIVSTEDIEKETRIGLNSLIEKCTIEGKRLLILENGGYAVPIFHNEFSKFRKICLGAVEETKQGLWRDENLKKIHFPVFQVATSSLKSIESAHLGEPVVSALTRILKEIGLSIQGKVVGVLGYGWIGSSVARYLKSRMTSVYCYDIKMLKLLDAHYMGFVNGNRKKLFADCDIIIGATGKNSINRKDFQFLKSGVFLASASSKNIEFDISALEKYCDEKSFLSEKIVQYKFNKLNKTINLISNGEPINFTIESMPAEIMELILTELYSCLIKLCEEKHKPKIVQVPGEIEEMISKIWFTTRGMKDI